MKKTLSIITILLCIANGLFAQEFNKEQLELRLELVKFLSNEGFEPEIDSDGDIYFKRNDIKHFLIINKSWANPFLVTFYTSFQYSDDGYYTKDNIAKCINAVAQHKSIKLHCWDNNYSFEFEVFCKNAEVIKETLYAMFNEFDATRSELRTILETGIAGIDIVNNKDAVFEKACDYYMENNYEKSLPLFRYLANNGYEKAYRYMGLAYHYGEGVSKDEDTMKKYYDKAIECGDYFCAYAIGLYYYSNGNYTDAMEYMVKCGANENSRRYSALHVIGRMYEYGEGTEKNMEQAIKFYRKSVQYSKELDCKARYALIRLGETIESKDEFVDATKSMLAGLTPKEMFEKGEECENGIGQYVSLTKAYAFYKASADKGYIDAISKMGDIYISEFYPFNDKAKSDKYFAKAIRGYKKDADSNDKSSYKLGIMYQNGYGTEKDLEQAKFYYKKSALLGNINSAWRIGIIYKDEMEYTEAFKFFLKAAEGGQGMAMYELANLFENGLGTRYDREKAIEWYRKCAASQYSASDDAKEALERLVSNDGKE